MAPCWSNTSTSRVFGRGESCQRLWVRGERLVGIIDTVSFSLSFSPSVFFFALDLLPFPSLFFFLRLSQAASAAAAAAAPSPVSSTHATTDTELANATPRIEGAVASLLHKSDAPVDSVVDLIGGTPLVRLRESVPPEGAVVLAKLESLQPNSSVKDR